MQPLCAPETESWNKIMSIRPPQIYYRPDAAQDPLSAALQHEIFNEKASTLGRLQKKLEIALTQLEHAKTLHPKDEELIGEKLAVAREALWFVTIQRELCGLIRHKPYYDHMNVPKDVRLHMGPIAGKR